MSTYLEPIEGLWLPDLWEPLKYHKVMGIEIVYEWELDKNEP